MRDRYEKQATIARRKSASKSGENSATTTPAAITTAASLSAIILRLPIATGTQWAEAIAGWFPDSFTGTSKWFQDRIGAWNARKGEGGFGKGEGTVRRKAGWPMPWAHRTSAFIVLSPSKPIFRPKFCGGRLQTLHACGRGAMPRYSESWVRKTLSATPRKPQPAVASERRIGRSRRGRCVCRNLVARRRTGLSK